MPQVVTTHANYSINEMVPTWVSQASRLARCKALRLKSGVDFFATPKYVCERLWAYGRDYDLTISAKIVSAEDTVYIDVKVKK